MKNGIKDIDCSSPEDFMATLRERAKDMKDSDFKDVHSMSGDHGSSSWGGVRICVGMARQNGVVAIRNTNDPDKIQAMFTEEEWNAFLDGVKAGHFDA